MVTIIDGDIDLGADDRARRIEAAMTDERFTLGVHRIDFAIQERPPKVSAGYHRGWISRNAVV